MASHTDVTEIDNEGNISKKRKFDQADFCYIAEYVIDEFNTRKTARKDREKHWKEIDRQVAMIPNLANKRNAQGVIDPARVWMAEVELPLQAQCLEVCTADARRFMFPDSGPWFEAHAEMTDKYLERIDFQSIILGDEAEVPSKINQDNADKLVEGYLLDLMQQNDFQTRMDRINAEAFKYGMGVGRGRKERKNVYIHESRGTRKEKQVVPVLAPCSIKNLYLDEPMPSMHSSMVLGQAHIAYDRIKLADLRTAASKGSSDPEDEDGGWMPGALKGIEADKDGYIEVLEMEGDIVVPRKTVRSVVIPGAIVTVIKGSVGKGSDAEYSSGLVRFRFRKAPYSSYLLFPYHYESTDDAYPTSPLEKGRPIQIAATDALNRLMDSAMLKIAPPCGYDRADTEFAQNGGPRIEPFAIWGTTDPVVVHDKIGGDTGALAQCMTLAINLYGELTGVLPARLGAQTVSHTTAFAKDAELQRGAVRTVDYVKQSGQGPLVRWLYMAYDMGRNTIGTGEKVSFYIPAYGGFVAVNKEHLPDRAAFEWSGSGGPAEEAQKLQAKVQGLQLALQIDQLSVQMGNPPRLNAQAAVDQILRQSGWSDLDVITNQNDAGAATQEANPGAVSVALQQIGLAGQQ